MNTRQWLLGVMAAMAFGAVLAADPPATADAMPMADGGAGTGTVVFFRPKKFAGAAIGFIVREGTDELGKLRNGTYFVIHPTAGVHEYVVHSESKDVLRVEVEEGETYYVQGTIGVGIMVGRPNLSPSDAATYEGMKAKLKLAKPLKDDKDEDADEG